MDIGNADDDGMRPSNCSTFAIQGKIYADFIVRVAKWSSTMSDDYDGRLVILVDY